jgi:class 3 adenylate cyclase/tetratricopeptide (TPR) repeat protein
LSAATQQTFTPDLIQAELAKIRAAMAGLEAQRAVLGEALVEPALAAMRQQLALLEVEATLTHVADERRIVTILFSDIVGSTSLAERLDPEDWRQVIAMLHSMAGQTVQQHAGNVVQYLGDGLLALFGAQAARERDPENAIRAALDMQSGLAVLHTEPPIQMRVGIHTGLVVVGELGSEARREFTATGDAMNLAARLQSAAPPGGIIISHDTFRHVRGVFDVTPQPLLTVKGKSEPIQTYVVQRAKPRPFRTVTRGVTGIETRTFGRQAELQQLVAAFQLVCRERKVVWAQLVGEPGMGKSRLLGDMIEHLSLQHDDIGVLRARAFQGDEKQPFGLVRGIWFDRFQIAEDVPLAEAEAKWQAGFLDLRGPGFEESAHALGLLVGLPFRDSPHIGAMRHNPAQVKGRALVVSRDLLNTLRVQMPVVLLLEDLHWADISSWDYLTQVVLGDDAPAPGLLHGIFVLATARSEWNPPAALLKYPDYFQINLASLSDTACREFVIELLRSVEDVPEEVVQLVADRSEGVPYFVEEMINWFLDRGIIDRRQEPWHFNLTRLEESPLPATLQHLLLTRLSSLQNAERSALQCGSVFGRSFWEGGLSALGARADAQLLGPLQSRGLVDAQPESSFAGESEWSFHHSLLQQVTYESMLKRERKTLHKAAAAWLEAHAQRAGRLDEFVGTLGEHAERAGEMTAAADWYMRAGERAKAQGAPLEAKRFFGRSLELALPTDRERRWQAMLGRSDVLSLLGEMEAYQASVTALLALASDFGGGRLMEAFYRQGSYLEKTGDCRAALHALEQVLAAAQRVRQPRLEALALALKLVCQSRLGDRKGATASVREALALVGQVDQSTASKVLSNVAGYYIESGDLARGAEIYGEQAAVNRRLGDRAAEADALGNLGYDYICLGLYTAGRTALEESLRIHDAIGARRARAYVRLNLGLAYWRDGDGCAAYQLLEQLQQELGAIGDAFALAAGLNYLALSLEQSGDVAGAELRFTQAGETFGSLGVQSYATDALAGLARCALARGDPDAARQQALRVWDYLLQHGAEGIEFAVWAFLTCAQVFEAVGEAQLARAAAEEGYRELIKRADRISNFKWGRSFLENVPEHRAMLDKWDRMAGSPARPLNRQ